MGSVHRANRRAYARMEVATYEDVEFLLKHYKLGKEDEIEHEKEDTANEENEEEWIQCQKDALDISNDFVKLNDDCMEIARYYGVREFLVLIPARKTNLTDETRIKIVLSSLTIASNNANCYVPILVQIQEPWQKMYLGYCAGKGTSVNLDMVHLKKVPLHCRYLTGLLTLFKQKIGEGCGVKIDSVMVSVRFSYLLKDWTNSTWTQEPPDFDFMQGETLGVAELGKLPFGATFDPIRELHLFVTWPQMSDNVVVDSEGYSDLDAQLAPEWSVQVKMVALPACLLGEYMTDFLHLCNNQKTMVELLGESASYIHDDEQMLSSAFSVLTESRIPTITTVVGRANAKKNKNIEGPISEEILLPILYFLFPDADENSKFPYNDIIPIGEDDQWKGVKTCTMDSLVWRLSVVAAHCTHNLGGATALAQLWHEFVQEIRFRWEKNVLIPGVGPGFPDSVRTCLLHQKLQMMNCCITRKKTREENAHRSQSIEIDDVDETESEDEFFECTSEELTSEEVSSTKSQLKAKHLLWNKPSGRLAKHSLLRLIQTGDPLYLPITQDPVPKTEDQLEEDAQVMMQLGTDKYASEMRARMMSASLLSDMESFKAANPGAVLEDFIRWYSPRDWIDDEGIDEWGQGKGHLSQRMMIPDNPWSTTWASAQPVPAHRQKRLFDDTREAEKALHYLCSKRIGQIAQLLLPALTHAALYTLSSQKQEALPSLPDVAQSILNKLQHATKPIYQKLQIYEEITRDIESVEALVAQVNSLQHKLGGNNDSKEFTSFLIQLMRGKEVSVPGCSRGDIGARITTMFHDAQKAAHMMTSVSNTTKDTRSAEDSRYKIFPEPSCKEFILRAIIPRPSPASTPQPQRLYVCLKRDHIRLAGFFSEDTIFL
ncbi:PREDICTED: rab3 GTPase-activating protein catalytic subunit isoform X1 [Cyphomyrmex costatus]|uniref:Rab3 GTPase-activating protein catalytic subunit n=1 Tax=Cyphomyrmex costatus TaxID=456900 RepID=A0A151I854_9HYME|nr:PREDICTED: rab3 GTPase-activating protein catalytic subunit isoform X1 [Cyphomyrmex costatus]KYM94324.1 Rab3 GTPase-activating protein catalytic subunit [Cyphomyrmex costatus]